jgi:hypothetical protein
MVETQMLQATVLLINLHFCLSFVHIRAYTTFLGVKSPANEKFPVNLAR